MTARFSIKLTPGPGMTLNLSVYSCIIFYAYIKLKLIIYKILSIHSSVFSREKKQLYKNTIIGYYINYFRLLLI